MNRRALEIENLLQAFPDDRQAILLKVDKAKEYSQECGCSLGAKFLAAALVVFVIYFFRSNDFGLISILKELGLGMFFIFTASVVGKLIGIGIARIKLALLYDQLMTIYHVPGE